MCAVDCLTCLGQGVRRPIPSSNVTCFTARCDRVLREFEPAERVLVDRLGTDRRQRGRHRTGYHVVDLLVLSILHSIRQARIGPQPARASILGIRFLEGRGKPRGDGPSSSDRGAAFGR